MSNVKLAKLFFSVALILMATVLTISTWTFLNDEDRYGPEGIENAFTVNSLPASAEASDVVSAIQSEAESTGTNVYKTWPAPDDGVFSTDYYLFSGDADRIIGDVEQGTFPSFGGMYTGSLKLSDELTSEQLYGSYAVQGSSGDRDAFASTLADMGAEVSISTVPNPLLRWPLQVLAGPIGGAIIVAWLALAMASLNLVTARMTIAATRLSSGVSSRFVLLRDAASLCLPSGLAAVVPTALVIGYSLIWANGYRSATAIAMLPAQFAFVLSAVVIALGLQRLFTRNLSIGKVITGARPVGLLAVVAILGVLASGLLGTSTAATLADRGHEYQSERKLDGYWQTHSGMSVMNLSYAAMAEDSETVHEELSAIYRDTERAGEVLLSEGEVLNFRGGPIESQTAVVNSDLVRSLGVLDSTQVDEIEQHVAEPGGAVILVPPDLPDASSDIAEATHEWFAFQASLDGDENPNEPEIAVVEGIDLGIVPRFDTAFGGIDPMYLESPALIVTDVESGLLSEDFYSASGAYLDPSSILQTLNAAEDTALWVTAFQDLEDSAALKAANDRADLWAATVALITMFLVIIVAWTLIASIHLSRERTRIFLMWTTGSSFFAIHWRFLAWACAGVVLPSAAYLLVADLPLSAMLWIFTGQTIVGLGSVTAALVLLGRQHNQVALQDS